MLTNLEKPLIILEMANNHMGDKEHGLKIINEFYNVTKNFPQYDFAFKFQYRQLDTFIHPDYKDRMDIKYVKRFTETKIPNEFFMSFKKEAEKLGFKTLCTPFDNESVSKVVNDGFKYIKIASCSFTDWPLLEEITKQNLPIVASTAGATFEEIDRVVTFLENRKKDFAIMHCVAEYPTLNDSQQLNTIDTLKERYKNIQIGLSTHEDPADTTNIGIAVGKGVRIFEKHVGVKTDKYAINGYSITPTQFEKWMNTLNNAFIACGEINPKKRAFTEKARASLLDLRRAVFAKTDIKKGEILTDDKIFYAIPRTTGQVQANDVSKYTDFIADTDIKTNEAIILGKNSHKVEKRERVHSILKNVQKIVDESGVKVPQKIDIEISHHYGIDRFEEVGCTLFTFINREYCKKLIVSLAGQKHPTQYHKEKEEAFHILHGTVMLKINDEPEKEYLPGDIVVIERGMKHSFWSPTGSIIEEISSTHIKNDSFYIDENILKNKNRKTQITYWFNN